MAISEQYRQQVSLLVRVLPLVARENCFALSERDRPMTTSFGDTTKQEKADFFSLVMSLRSWQAPLPFYRCLMGAPWK